MHGATRIYLDELCELYLSGRDLAVFLLARSALDETVEGVIESRSLADDFDQWRKEARTKGVYPTMEDRLKFLKFRGLLSQYLFDQADRIRLQGNSAAHDHSKLIAMNPSAKETMRSLSAIMKELSKTSDG